MANEGQSNQLNLTVVALVALVAIVGLVALVMNAASIAKAPKLATGSQEVSAQPTELVKVTSDTQPKNIGGSAYCSPAAYDSGTGKWTNYCVSGSGTKAVINSLFN